MKILEFQTLDAAEQALVVINKIVVDLWKKQGFTVDGVELIGKNASTGADEPGKTRTTTWDTVNQSQDGTFYFSSPANNPRFVDWRDYLPIDIIIPDDKEVSQEWRNVEYI